MCTNCKDGVCSSNPKGKKCLTFKIMSVLVIIGGLNWGLTGLGMILGMNLNLVNLLLGSMPTLESLIYLIVGISAVGSIFGCPCKTCKDCCSESTANQTPVSGSTI